MLYKTGKDQSLPPLPVWATACRFLNCHSEHLFEDKDLIDGMVLHWLSADYILRGEQKTQSVLYGMRTIGQGEVSAKTEILRNQEHTTSSKSKGTQWA